jgi:flagellar protein FliS
MSYALRYSQAQAETATPERLMVLLFDAALRHMNRGAAELEAGRHGDAEPSLTRAAEIVTELLVTLDPNRGAPDVCDTLGELYRFVNGRLLQANLHRDAAKAQEAARVFAPIADGFREAVARLAIEQKSAAA